MLTWKDFENLLLELRRANGLTQQGLAQKIGCSRVHIARLERGTRRPSRLLLRAIRHETSTDTCQKKS